MVRQRIQSLLADYEDQNDHDELRSDAVFKLIADRLPDGLDLASQPTLSPQATYDEYAERGESENPTRSSNGACTPIA